MTVDDDLLQLVEVLDHGAGAQHDRVQRTIGDQYRADQSSRSGKSNASISDSLAASKYAGGILYLFGLPILDGITSVRSL